MVQLAELYRNVTKHGKIYLRIQYICITIFQLCTAAFKAYCVIWVRRSNFCHQASPREHPAAEGGNVGEKCLGILPKSRLPRYI